MKENSEFHILIVDDTKFNIEVVVEYLSPEGYNLAHVSSGKSALKAVQTRNFDLILLDINMPEMDGYEVCKRLKQDVKTALIPIIFLSALNDIDAIIKAFEFGGVDYLSKPFNGLELIARVKTQIQLRKYFLEIQEKQGKLAQLAATDSATGLSNKIHFMSIIKKEIIDNKKISLAYISVDHMQKINSLYGYKAGDKVLLNMSKMMKSKVRKEDTLARLFGSEFVLLMPNTEYEEAIVLAKNIHKEMDKLPISGLKVSCSIGVTHLKNDASHEAFILRCEKLMEEAKELGGDRVISRI